MPNLLAYLALILWIPATLALCGVFRPTTAAIWLSLGGWMFLPERLSFDAPGLPPIDKSTLTPALLLACFLVLRPNRVVRSRFGRGSEFFAIVLIFAQFGTTLTNPEALTYGKLTIPGLSFHNSISMICGEISTLVIPFLIGRIAVQTSKELRLLVTSAVVAAVLYTPLMLFEIRMSPQLHTWIYGYPAHEDFLQSMRAGGYRPSVFMSHGLTVAMFMVIGLLSALGLYRAKIRLFSYSSGLIAAYLGVILVLCKSMASMIYAGVFGLLIMMLRPKGLLRVCCIVSFLVLLYPISRATATFPCEAIIAMIRPISEERAESLKFRFDNEDTLLARAAERPWFGWGQWGRNRIYNEYGKDVSITDGGWIIMLGCSGIVGMVCYFVILLGPIWSAARRLRRIQDKTDRILVATLASIIAIAAIDVLPNALATTCQLFLAGALLGVSRTLSKPSYPATNQPNALVASTEPAKLAAHS